MASDNQLTDQDLHAFIDGELDGRGYRAVVGRIAADPELAERANAFLRQRAELAQLRSFFEPDDTPDVANAATEALVQQLAARIRHRRRVRLSLAGSSIAAAALIGLMTAVGPTPREVAGRLSWRTAIEAGPQVLFGRDPFATTQLVAGTTTDGPIVWLDQQLAHYSVRRPDLAAYGLTFVGGNALQGGDAPAIRLVYQDSDKRHIFLFIGTVGSDADVALTLVPEGHVSLNWRRGQLVFALIGPKESQQLLDVLQTSAEFLAPPPEPALLGQPPTQEAAADDVVVADPTTKITDSVVHPATLPTAVEAEPVVSEQGLSGDAAGAPLTGGAAGPPALVPPNTAKSL